MKTTQSEICKHRNSLKEHEGWVVTKSINSSNNQDQFLNSFQKHPPLILWSHNSPQYKTPITRKLWSSSCFEYRPKNTQPNPRRLNQTSSNGQWDLFQECNVDSIYTIKYLLEEDHVTNWEKQQMYHLLWQKLNNLTPQRNTFLNQKTLRKQMNSARF